MDGIYSTTSDVSSKQLPWSRDQISQLVERLRFDQQQGTSLNRSASEHHVPRTTAQNWIRNRARLEQLGGLDLTAVQFFRITPRARVPT